MYKLSFRGNWPVFAASILFTGLGLITAIKFYADSVMEVNIFFFAFVEVVLALAVGYFVAANTPPPDFVRAVLTKLLTTMLYGTLGNVVSQTTMVLPDYAMLINYLQWACMEIGGAVITFALYKVESVSIYAPASNVSLDTKAKRLPKEPKSAPSGESLEQQGKTGPLGLDKLLDKLSCLAARSGREPIDEVELAGPSKREVGNGKLEEKRSEVIPTRVISSRKKATSTFTKLQALSKSGTGARERPLVDDTNEAEGLRSILDRLETSKFGNDELSVHSLFMNETSTEELPQPSGAEDKASQAIKISAQEEKEESGHDNESPQIIEANSAFIHVNLETPAPEESKREPQASFQADIGARLMSAISSSPKSSVPSSVVSSKPLSQPQAKPSESRDEAERGLSIGILDGAEKVEKKVSEGVLTKQLSQTPVLPEVQTPVSPIENLASPLPLNEAGRVETQLTPEEEERLFEAGIDKDIDDIFSNIAPPEAQVTVSEEVLAKIRAAEKVAQSQDKESSSGETSTQADGEAIARAEHGRAPTEDKTLHKSAPGEPPLREQPIELPVEAKDSSQGALASGIETELEKTSQLKPAHHEVLREFGRLSAKSALPPSPAESAGTMKTIGKLLNEVQVVEKIIEAESDGTSVGAGLTTARIISAIKGEGIKSLLGKIDTYEGVSGSVIVGLDGLVIASTLSAGMDKDMLGAMSVAIMGSSGLATKKLDIGRLQQMVMVTDNKITILTDVGIGILAVFMEAAHTDRIDGLLQAIQETING